MTGFLFLNIGSGNPRQAGLVPVFFFFLNSPAITPVPKIILKDENTILLLHSPDTISTQMVAGCGAVTFALRKIHRWRLHSDPTACTTQHLIVSLLQPAQEHHLTESAAGAWPSTGANGKEKLNTSPNQSGKAERIPGRRGREGSRRQNSQRVAGAFPQSQKLAVALFAGI